MAAIVDYPGEVTTLEIVISGHQERYSYSGTTVAQTLTLDVDWTQEFTRITERELALSHVWAEYDPDTGEGIGDPLFVRPEYSFALLCNAREPHRPFIDIKLWNEPLEEDPNPRPVIGSWAITVPTGSPPSPSSGDLRLSTLLFNVQSLFGWDGIYRTPMTSGMYGYNPAFPLYPYVDPNDFGSPSSPISDSMFAATRIQSPVFADGIPEIQRITLSSYDYPKAPLVFETPATMDYVRPSVPNQWYFLGNTSFGDVVWSGAGPLQDSLTPIGVGNEFFAVDVMWRSLVGGAILSLSAEDQAKIDRFEIYCEGARDVFVHLYTTEQMTLPLLQGRSQTYGPLALDISQWSPVAAFLPWASGIVCFGITATNIFDKDPGDPTYSTTAGGIPRASTVYGGSGSDWNPGGYYEWDAEALDPSGDFTDANDEYSGSSPGSGHPSGAHDDSGSVTFA